MRGSGCRQGLAFFMLPGAQLCNVQGPPPQSSSYSLVDADPWSEGGAASAGMSMPHMSWARGLGRALRQLSKRRSVGCTVSGLVGLAGPPLPPGSADVPGVRETTERWRARPWLRPLW